MRFAFTIFKYFPHGGLQRDCLEIAQTCRQRGHDVTLFTMEWEGPVPSGLRVCVVSPKGFTNHGRCISFVRQILPVLKRESFDVVVGFNKMPGLDIYFAGDSCYADQSRRNHMCRWSPYYWATPRFRQYSALERAVFSPQSPTEILLLTASQQETYRTHYGTPANRFHVLPPGICQDRKPAHDATDIRTDIRNSFLRNSEELLLLAVGADAKRKGLDRTIHALSALPTEVRSKTRLVAVGERRTLPFERLARRLSVSDRITLLPPRTDIPRFFHGADLLVHPAHSEAGGTVLLESMAYGLPVLATDVCGYSKYVEASQSGFIIPSPFQQQYMNNSLHYLLTASQLQSLSHNARAFAHSTILHSRSEHIATIIESRS